MSKLLGRKKKKDKDDSIVDMEIARRTRELKQAAAQEQADQSSAVVAKRQQTGQVALILGIGTAAGLGLFYYYLTHKRRK